MSDWNVGDEILYCGKRCSIVASNGSGSTIELEWPDGSRGYYESYGHGVTIEPIATRTKTRSRQTRKGDA